MAVPERDPAHAETGALLAFVFRLARYMIEGGLASARQLARKRPAQRQCAHARERTNRAYRELLDSDRNRSPPRRPKTPTMRR